MTAPNPLTYVRKHSSHVSDMAKDKLDPTLQAWVVARRREYDNQ